MIEDVQSLKSDRKEFFDACFDLIPHRPKGLAPFFSWCQYGSRIFEAPMKETPRVGPTGTRLLGPIAHGNHIVERLVDKFIHSLRPLCGNIDTQLLHGRHRAGVETDGMRSGTRDVIPISGQMAQQPFRHLAAGGITRTEKQHSLFHEQHAGEQQAAGLASGFVARTNPLRNLPSMTGAMALRSKSVPSNRSRASAAV